MDERGSQPEPGKLTAFDIRARKGGPKLSMLSLYDFPFARIAAEAGLDIILVGDSLGMVIQGHDSTVPVTLDDVVYHSKAVRRGAPKTHIVADLPFLTYHIDSGRAVENAGRLMQEGNADSVKLEGGEDVAERIAALTRAGIPVMGHIGLTPQSAGALGGLTVQGRDIASARKILADALAVTEAGAFAMVVEIVPTELAEAITASVAVPTIGIGAGPFCDGQVLLAHDMLGLQERIIGRFAKVYAEIGDDIRMAFVTFGNDVRSGAFPDEGQSYPMAPDVVAQIRERQT
ncbi:MAG: 3-methyl-2-oxobutanoate hydroxymethyltransferase [Chloroflexota bacterium]|nr:3-methyl-2-oxobutanoate hydroxymethyltransferase [Chloroflexota bacterium]